MPNPIVANTRERIVLDLRTLGVPEVPMLGRYNYILAHRGLAPHIHPGTVEICLLAKGTQLYRVGQRNYLLRGGDVFVTFPGERHSTGEAPEEKGTLYWIQIIPPARSARFLNCPAPEARHLKAQLLSLPNRHFAADPRLQKILDEIIRVASSAQSPLQRTAIISKMVEFLLLLIDNSPQHPQKELAPEFSQLLRLIDEKIEEPLSVASLATRTSLSVSRFKARFKQEIGIPPAEYVLRRKISEAKKQLAKPGAQVTDITYRLNFSSSQYFATVFKRYTGTTPRTLLNPGGVPSTHLSDR
jgi:AraC-like DNA-binding protein